MHQEEDEAFYVLDGELMVLVDGSTLIATAGSYIFLPRQIPHGFRCLKEARVLIHAMPGGRSGFVGMMLEGATPITDRQNLPAPSEPDLVKLAELCQKNGIRVLGRLPLDDC